MALIVDLRVTEGLSYRVIAARLNEDLTAHPPPERVDPDRALDRWSPGSVRDIPVNPKDTGYTVWNPGEPQRTNNTPATQPARGMGDLRT